MLIRSVLKPKISVKFDKKGSVVKGSEEIKTIQFIPTAGFLKKVRKNTKFEYKKSEKNNETFEQRSVRFLSNIEEGTYFTRKKYASFIKKDYEVAVNDLKKLLKANIVSVVKMGNGLFYSKN